MSVVAGSFLVWCDLCFDSPDSDPYLPTGSFETAADRARWMNEHRLEHDRPPLYETDDR